MRALLSLLPAHPTLSIAVLTGSPLVRPHGVDRLASAAAAASSSTASSSTHAAHTPFSMETGDSDQHAGLHNGQQHQPRLGQDVSAAPPPPPPPHLPTNAAGQPHSHPNVPLHPHLHHPFLSGPPAGMHRPQIAAPRSASWHAGHPPIQDTRTQLSVSNLPFRVRWQDLKDLMRKCGTVLRADVALSPVDGRSRGFGVVLFARHEDAMKAIDMYHGFAWQTRVLDVRIDSHDPRGEIALAEANRQQAMQQQAERFQHAIQHQPQYTQNLQPPLPHQASNGGTTPTMQNAMFPATTSSPRPATPSWPLSMDASSSNMAASSPKLHPSVQPQSTASPRLAALRAVDEVDPRASRQDGTQHSSGQARSVTPVASDRVHTTAVPQAYGGPGGMMPPSNYGVRPPAAGLNPVPAQYVGRHLFVGNLPFNCQWQELKDLMRQCGNVLRADIATGLDGRSRGFGSVLFATTQDAERAVQQLNGYEFNGRPLKVHFDKYSSAIPQPGHGQAPGPAVGGYQMHHHPPLPPQANSFGAFGMHLQPNQPAQRHIGPAHSFGHADMRTSAQIYGNGFFETDDPRAQAGSVMWQQPTTGSTSLAGVADDLLLPSSVADKLTSSAGGSGTDRVQSESDRNAGEDGQVGSTSPSSRTHHPSRISMPPPSSFPFSVNGGPLSPMTGGRLPPMTPSMPAFTLGAFPQTPPVYPQSFFSPGVGPFSPQVGSPYFGPNLSYLNGGMNAAPGAPVHRQMPLDYNPMFPMTTAQQSAASPGNGPDLTDGETTPQQQLRSNGDQNDAGYFPDVSGGNSGRKDDNLRETAQSAAGSTGRSASSQAVSSSDSSLNPPVPDRNASAPNLSPRVSASTGHSSAAESKPPRPDVALHSRSADPVTDQTASSSSSSSSLMSSSSSSASPNLSLEQGMSSLKLDVASSSGAGWGDLSRPTSTPNESMTSSVGVGGGGHGDGVGPPRRRSYVPGATIGPADLDVRRRFEREFLGSSPSSPLSVTRSSNGNSSSTTGTATNPTSYASKSQMGPSSSTSSSSSSSLMTAQEALQARRASFEDVNQIVNKQRMKFGTSIWGTI
ncbi:hypothetical protein OIV83_001546 [Microbotryomycetes sp. JL201]|nr:hypothetical protein OIV83_001546 [Microbotryomycetes sp. JL201]